MTDVAKRFLLDLQEYVLLLGRMARRLVRGPVHVRDLIEQLDTIGVGSLVVILLTGAFTGMVLVLQTGTTMDQFGARPVAGRIASASMVRELGPVLSALLLTGRVGSGIAAELGSMTVTYQVDSLRVLGSDPVRKLVLPRVLAGTLMLPVLTALASAAGIAAGGVISSTQLGVASSVYWHNVVEGLRVEDLWMGGIKSVVLGFAITSIACHVGLRTTGGTRGVGRSTNRAVVVCSIVVLVANFVLTKLIITLLY